MIQSFTIKNFGFFRDVQLEFSSGFTAITGETGAGKSTFLEAIKAVLGHKIAKNLCAENDTTVLELVIKNSTADSQPLTADSQIFLRLVVKNQSRPRYFINEEPIKQADVKHFTDQWFVLHAQHEISSLKKNSTTRDWLDTFAGISADLVTYQTDWKKYLHLQKQREEFLTDSRDNDLEYWQFLAEELAAENLEPEFVSSLEDRVKRAANQEKIIQTSAALAELIDGSGGLIVQAEQAQKNIEQLQKLGVELGELPLDPVTLIEQLQDFSAMVSALGETDEYDDHNPQTLQQTYQRLLRLQEKHNVHSFTDLAEVEISIQQKIGDIQQRETRLSALKKELSDQQKKLAEHAAILHQKRTAAAEILSQNLAEKVQPLGIPKAQFIISVEKTDELNRGGCSKIEWYFSANPGKNPELLSTSASGGELSRVMLALYQLLHKNLSNRADSRQPTAGSQTLFFDEIDTGISGEVLQKMAEQFHLLGQNQQILTITHHGIMASQADQHWHIRKSQTDHSTESRIEMLDDQSRARVIAELLSGAKEKNHAEDLARKLIGFHEISGRTRL